MKVSVSEERLTHVVDELRSHVNTRLPQLVEGKTPEELYAPVRYVLEGGGKRLRPVLLMLTAKALGATVQASTPAALAVEVFHNFTLVHDDIMDHAEARRGRPTVHVRWDEPTAILTGDLMMALSYELLTQSPPEALPSMLPVYHRMVERLCVGQALDKAFETRPEVSVEAYIDMIDGKTGALLSAVFELGAIIGEASPEQQQALSEAGTLVGRAFQIQDDLLDLVADPDTWGKDIGSDLMEGKKTFLTLRALEHADGDEHAWFERITTEGGLPRADIPEARARMDRLGIFDEARQAVETYSREALNRLKLLHDSSRLTSQESERAPDAQRAAEALQGLIIRMQARTR